MTTNDKTCRTCRYWERVDYDTDKDEGFCIIAEDENNIKDKNETCQHYLKYNTRNITNHIFKAVNKIMLGCIK